MKGVILAGGTGSRLYPNTKVTNKHLLPVYNKPMIQYPIETLKRSGIRDILIVTGSDNAGDFMKLLGSGIDYGVHFTYRVQDGAGGIAQALSLAENFAQNESLAVILGDNIFEDSFEEEIQYFKEGAHIFAKEVEDPRRFGVITLDDENNVTSIVEKPDIPPSKYAQTGFYIYDNKVFDYIKSIEPSERGELEITDVNSLYVKNGSLTASIVPNLWVDAGTHTSLLEASILSQETFAPDRILNRRSRSLRSSTEPAHFPSVTVGIVTYNSAKYIEACLHSLETQDYENMEIVIFDNNSEDNTVELIEDRFSEVTVITSDKNLGFGKSHNEIIRQTDAEYYLCLNIDMILEPNFVSEMVKGMVEKSKIGSIGGKIKKWDFEAFATKKDQSNKGKTNFIDSVGIRAFKSHRFVDIGQGEVDNGQFDHTKEVFGISGAAVMYRRKALEDVAHRVEKDLVEYFDEAMFMYKEDIDLSYRLQWGGWKAIYTPQAVCYHDRTAHSAEEGGMVSFLRHRNERSKLVNRISYMNHNLMLQKNFSEDYSPKMKGATWMYNFKVFCYILVFETEHLSSWFRVLKLRKNTKEKRQSMPRRTSHQEIEKLMEG